MAIARRVLICLIMFYNTAEAARGTFEGFLSGTPCYKSRVMAGCEGTLLDNFDIGDPEKTPDTRMLLFTRKNKEEPEFLHDCGGTVPDNTFFDAKNDVEVIVHGWLDGICRTAWMREMMYQLLYRGDYNVILVDWSWGNTPDYFLASNNTKIVGDQLGFVIRNIMEKTNIGPEKFHIIGHSFGSHIAGFAGQTLPKIRRITALDPALVPFQDVPPEKRLDPTDARMVDVIHSNAGDCPFLTLGHYRPLGHSDFYVNGGTVQHSCYPYILISLLKGDFLYALTSLSPTLCYHLQSLQFFKVSINPCDCQFIGVECPSYEDFKAGKCSTMCTNDNCEVMGMDWEFYPHHQDNSQRTFYLETKLACPYCMEKLSEEEYFPVNKTQCF